MRTHGWQRAVLLAGLLIGCGEVTIVDTEPACVDSDRDGVYRNCGEIRDCDDFDPDIPGPERCNFVDDDCDGRRDEDFPMLREACMVGDCHGTLGCEDGEAVCRGTFDPFDEYGERRAETCDGADEDCDGLVDEALPWLGQPCATDEVGVCAAGRLRCVDARPLCVGDFAPAALDDVCNGLDDDCDGVIDELTADPTCYPGPEGTAGVGLCRRGVRRCELGRHRTCVGAITPDGERCDGRDEDCDGAVDEGLDCACVEGEERPCPPRAPALDGRGPCVGATQRCVDGAWGRCDGRIDPRPETCDGRDEDCDGAIDEQAAAVDAPCEVGLGECRAAGSTFCAEGRLQCDAVPGRPAAETCTRRIDDDCDGVTLPREVGRACGEAGNGVYICDDSVLQCLEYAE